jgi:SAM-dependent methyltransferase
MNVQQNGDLRNWIACWNAWQEPDKPVGELGSAGFWNRAWGGREDRIRKRLKPGRKERLIRDLFGMLEEAGLRVDGARILDVGCGPGALTIPLARAGARVTALDISSKALEYVRETAEREELSVDPIECSWWTADIDELGFRKKFDLVIASMTPSIKDLETFGRMTACSRKYCYYAGSVPGGRERFHKEIYKNILKTDPPRNTHGGSWFLYHFMYLYLGGYRPLVRIHRMNHRMESTWEEAADMAIRSIGREGTCTEAMKKKIRAYYKTAAFNGKCTSRAGGYMGMMLWDIRRCDP